MTETYFLLQVAYECMAVLGAQHVEQGVEVEEDSLQTNSIRVDPLTLNSIYKGRMQLERRYELLPRGHPQVLTMAFQRT